jgi:hypothetical protein
VLGGGLFEWLAKVIFCFPVKESGDERLGGMAKGVSWADLDGDRGRNAADSDLHCIQFTTKEIVAQVQKLRHQLSMPRPTHPPNDSCRNRI